MKKLVLLSLLLASAAFGAQYQVTVNTIGAPASGWLDFQFNQGLTGSQSAFVTIGAFAPGGNLTGSPVTSGPVSGTLPSTVTINNSTAFNDYFQAFNFGPQITFLVTLDGPALQTPDGTSTSKSSFAFSMFASDQVTPLLTSDPGGSAVTIDVNLNGTTTVTNFSTATSVSAIPEPASLALAGAGLLLLFGLKSRRN
ncbi:MAG: NF038129 family PEP-CTERM protein [Bryobacterales bacterium]|nr:NF038129 family PEP-CTERM protein [Bryobacterales bacterium]